MKVELLPAFEDNYLFVIADEAQGVAAAVDPGDAFPILDFLKSKQLELTNIFVTHHHADHIGGLKLLKEVFPKARVTCSVFDGERGRVPFVDQWLKEGDTVSFGRAGQEIKGTVLDVPAHTKGHIAYFFDSQAVGGGLKENALSIGQATGDGREGVAHPWLFCGDTLFGAGSGGLFEGTPEMLLEALKKFRALPPETLIFCAHEYTEKNLWVALKLGEQNPAQKERFEDVAARRVMGKRTVPLKLSEETETNPFLRWDQPSLKLALNTSSDLETLTAVRKFRDKF